MNAAEAALRLVGRIYEAATDASLWPDVLQQLAIELGGTTTGFLVHDIPARPNGSVAAIVNTDPELAREYDAYYHSINLHAEKVPTKQPGFVVSSQQYIADGELLPSEYYNDFLRRYELFHLLSTFIAEDPKQIVSMYSFRSLRAGPFSDESFQLIQLLTPHLQNAAKLHSRLGALHAGCESLDSLSVGMIVVDLDGRVLQMNRSACQIVEANDGLAALLGRITAWNPGERAELLAIIGKASLAAMGNGLHADGSLPIHRPSGKQPYALRVRPLRSPRLLGAKQTAGAIIFVMDPETQDGIHPDALIRTFALTPAEARVALVLMNGKSIEECAADLQITINTARTHLKRILSKTGTQRQAELVRILLKSFTQLRG
jgi:DNA-binding CsgD family transcriptional regulator